MAGMKRTNGMGKGVIREILYTHKKLCRSNSMYQLTMLINKNRKNERNVKLPHGKYPKNNCHRQDLPVIKSVGETLGKNGDLA